MSSDSDDESYFHDENEFEEVNNALVVGQVSLDFRYTRDKSDTGYVYNSTVKFFNETRSRYMEFSDYEEFIDRYPCFRLRSHDCDEVFGRKIEEIVNRNFQDRPIPFYTAYLIVSMLDKKIQHGLQYSDIMEKILNQFC